jgi:hypothetical protein
LHKVIYTGHTLVSNNLLVYNGGSGSHAYYSHNVDFINNTAWHNGRVNDYGELSASHATNVSMFNNICVAAPGNPVNDAHNNTNLVVEHNLFEADVEPKVPGENTTHGDPRFVDPEPDVSKGNFQLQPDSIAVDRGLASLNDIAAPATDLTGAKRPSGGGWDLGAYELQGN